MAKFDRGSTSQTEFSHPRSQTSDGIVPESGNAFQPADIAKAASAG